MKTKKILRFYFSADSLNKAFDTLMVNKACAANSSGVEACEKLCSLVGDKIQLERLWGYLDGILSTFSEEERATLLKYSARRACLKSSCKEVKRAVVKFMRRARRLEEFEDSIATLGSYYCLICDL